MNGIIHICSHPNDNDPTFRISEDKIFSDIFSYIEVVWKGVAIVVVDVLMIVFLLIKFTSTLLRLFSCGKLMDLLVSSHVAGFV